MTFFPFYLKTTELVHIMLLQRIGKLFLKMTQTSMKFEADTDKAIARHLINQEQLLQLDFSVK